MRTFPRRAGLMVLTVALTLVIGSPASGGQRIHYEGEQSTGEYVEAFVYKRDSGRRFLSNLGFAEVEIVCEEGSSRTWGIGFGFSSRRAPGIRVDGGRTLDRTYAPNGILGGGPQYFARVTGTFRWANADGTLLFNIGALTDDGSNSQLCTSGPVTWTAERNGTRPARIDSAAETPDGFIRFRMKRNGELAIAEVVEPARRAA